MRRIWLTVPIVAHHVHFNVPKGSEQQAKEWYTRTFGGAAGKEGRSEQSGCDQGLDSHASPPSNLCTFGRRCEIVTPGGPSLLMKWQRQPARVTFHPLGSAPVTFDVRGSLGEIAPSQEAPEKEEN